MSERTAITPRRDEDYPEWYQAVVRAADMAEPSPVRGCMVIKPWGYGVWERIQGTLDRMIKATGHQNAYFPLFIPLSFLEKEAAHVEGFAKECAVVTHHRLEQRGGELVPTAQLEEPLVVRPTSETIIGDSFSRWIQSYRDLPLLINQWANIVRWEMRPRVFLRTAEFLWQEGHTAHSTEAEAMEETYRMLEVYRTFAEDYLALTVIPGEKSPRERFPGAVRTFCIEAMMQDHKALQAGTSHYLGQNFATASNIRFQNEKGELQFAYTTSWGVSTRLVGALIMAHSDDDGLRLPPRVAPSEVVILPVIKQAAARDEVMSYIDGIAAELGKTLRVHVDRRDIASQDKKWEWVKKGVPIRMEIGPRDIAAEAAMVARRDQPVRQSQTVKRADMADAIARILEEMQAGYLAAARDLMQRNTRRDILTLKEMTTFLEGDGGFVVAKWCGESACEDRITEAGASIRCIPFEQSGTEGECISCERLATTEVILAKAY
jgi:prolyl-tRNA synthetase